MGNKHTPKLLDNLPTRAKDFITLVIKKMRYRKKVRAEVLAELAYHFEDELRDCKTEQDKNDKALKLIEEFGDPKLIAILLRRAKKRCRPLWRTIVARSLQTATVLIVLLVLYIVWFITGTPNITTNYFAQLNDLVRPTVDESLNAEPYYLQAVELYEKNRDDTAEFRGRDSNSLTNEQRQMLETGVDVILGRRYEEATEQEKERAIRWFQKNEEIFDILADGSRKPYYWVTYKQDGDLESMMEDVMPRFNPIRRLAMALRWRIGWATAEGRCNDALEDVKTCYQLGRHLTGDKILIEQLVGIAIEALAIHSLRETLARCQADSSALSNFQREFETMTTDQKSIPSLKAERLLFYDGIQRYFIDDPFGGHLYLKELDAMIGGQPFIVNSINQRGIAVMPHILFTHPDKEQSRQMYDKLYDYWEKTSVKNPAQLRAEDIDFAAVAQKIAKGNLLLEVFASSSARVSELGHRLNTDTLSTLTIVALLRFKGDKGSYPDNLNDLMEAGYLKELPIDPYSDKPLVYRRTDDSFILYSFGADFDDDGGTYSGWGRGREGGDHVFWPLETEEQKARRRKNSR